jgi:hypothetical protein
VINFSNDLNERINASNEKWDTDCAAEILVANANVLEYFEKGMACQRYVPPRWESEGMKISWRNKLTRRVRLRSKYQQMTGDLVAATKSGLQLLRFGKMILDGSNCIYEWRGGNAYEKSALEHLEEIVADARTPESALREILAELERWDPAGMVAGCKNAMRGQYQGKVQTIREVMKGGRYHDIPDSARYIPYLLKPNMTSRYMVAFYRHQIVCADLPYAKITSKYRWRAPEELEKNLDCWFRPNSAGMVFFEHENWRVGDEMGEQESRCFIQAWISALQLKTSLRLYEIKHGKLPDDLHALVPEFLRDVPVDPFADKPFRYSKDRRLVWSSGPDGSDDEGSGESWNENSLILTGNYYNKDLVMPLGTRELKPNLAPKPSVP